MKRTDSVKLLRSELRFSLSESPRHRRLIFDSMDKLMLLILKVSLKLSARKQLRALSD